MHGMLDIMREIIDVIVVYVWICHDYSMVYALSVG